MIQRAHNETDAAADTTEAPQDSMCSVGVIKVISYAYVIGKVLVKWLMPTPSTIFAPLVSRAKATATATRKDARATASSSILGRVKAVCNKMLSHATFRSCDIRHFEDNGPRTKKPRCGPGYDGRKAAAARRARQAAAAARNNARAIASFSILGRVISLCNKLLSYVRYLTHSACEKIAFIVTWPLQRTICPRFPSRSKFVLQVVFPWTRVSSIVKKRCFYDGKELDKTRTLFSLGIVPGSTVTCIGRHGPLTSSPDKPNADDFALADALMQELIEEEEAEMIDRMRLEKEMFAKLRQAKAQQRHRVKAKQRHGLKSAREASLKRDSCSSIVAFGRRRNAQEIVSNFHLHATTHMETMAEERKVRWAGNDDPFDIFLNLIDGTVRILRNVRSLVCIVLHVLNFLTIQFQYTITHFNVRSYSLFFCLSTSPLPLLSFSLLFLFPALHVYCFNRPSDSIAFIKDRCVSLKLVDDHSVRLRWGLETLEDQFQCIGSYGVTKDANVYVLGRILGGGKRGAVPRNKSAAELSSDSVGVSGEDVEDEEEMHSSDEDFLHDDEHITDKPCMHTALNQQASQSREARESAMSVSQQYHETMHAVRGPRSRASGARQGGDEQPNTHSRSQILSAHSQNPPPVIQYQNKIRELIDQDKMFCGIFALAESLMADPQFCTDDGSCLVHRCTEDGQCILDANVTQGLHVLKKNSSADVTYILRCEIQKARLSAPVAASSSLNDSSYVSHLTLTSSQCNLQEIYVQLGSILRASREMAKTIQRELKEYSNADIILATNMAETSGLLYMINQHVGPKCNSSFKKLYEGRSELSVLRKTEKVYKAMLRRLRSPTPAMLARQSATTESQRKGVKAKKQRRQLAEKQAKASKNVSIGNRSWKQQAPARREDETPEQYCKRRMEELKHCTNPQPIDVQDYEKAPAAALVLFHMKAGLPTRHDPPACLTEDVLMLHRLNIFEFDDWSDSDVAILQSWKTLSTLVQEAKWLQTAADLWHILNTRVAMERTNHDQSGDAGMTFFVVDDFTYTLPPYVHTFTCRVARLVVCVNSTDSLFTNLQV